MASARRSDIVSTAKVEEIRFESKAGTLRPYVGNKGWVSHNALKKHFKGENLATYMKKHKNAVARYSGSRSARAPNAVLREAPMNSTTVLRLLAGSKIPNKLFTTKKVMKNALDKLMTSNTILTAPGLVGMRSTGNIRKNKLISAGMIVAAAIDRMQRHYEGSFHQAHAGDFLETTGFTIGALAVGADPIYYEDPVSTGGLGNNLNTLMTRPNHTIVLEAKIKLDKFKETLDPNGPWGDLVALATDPASMMRSNGPGRKKMTTWVQRSNSPYKGYDEVWPDILDFWPRGSVYNGVTLTKPRINILELKIGRGKPEQHPGEWFQLMKVKKAIEMFLGKENVDVYIYFVPWFYATKSIKPQFTGPSHVNAALTNIVAKIRTEERDTENRYTPQVLEKASQFESVCHLPAGVVNISLDIHRREHLNKLSMYKRFMSDYSLNLLHRSNANLAAIRNAMTRIAQAPEREKATLMRQYAQLLSAYPILSAPENMNFKTFITSLAPSSEAGTRHAKHAVSRLAGMIGARLKMTSRGAALGRRSPNPLTAELSNASNTSKALSYVERLSAAAKAPPGAFGYGTNYSGLQVVFPPRNASYYWGKLTSAKGVRNVKKLKGLVARTPLSENVAGPIRAAINNRISTYQAGLAPTLVQQAGSLAQTAFAPTNIRATLRAGGMTNAQINAALASGQL